MASFGQNGFTDQSADLNVRVRAEFLSASPSLSGSKGAAPTAEWLQEDASVICARQMPDRWTVCEHILADYEGQIPTQGCLSPAARQKPFSMRCSACGRCMENVSPSSNSKAPGISTRQDGGSRRLPRLSGWLDKVRIATQARGDSIERGPVEHPEKCSAVGQGMANQHQRSTRSSTKRPDLPGASPRSKGHPHTWVLAVSRMMGIGLWARIVWAVSIPSMMGSCLSMMMRSGSSLQARPTAS